MREILFRGKRTDTGMWVYGYFVQDLTYYGKEDHHAYIVSHEHPSSCFGSDIYIEVIPETVGQYTGLIDKNGKPIFEGDIVNITYPDTIVRNAVIIYVGASFCGDNGNDLWVLDDFIYIEVISNIHGNPELLKRRMNDARR